MSSLEASITLEDVFTVVEAKRVPLAPELAGYLSLEIADGTDAGSGDVDPKTVFISEEGTVALVRPKRDVTSGDAEASVRSLLTKLLDASGSGTPALTTAAKRKPGNGLPALVEELEAALIPVNRAAGRRALARLAREVKRVLLGVGRNASVAPIVGGRADKGPPPGRPSGEMKPVAAAPHGRPLLRKRGDDPRGAGEAPTESTREPASSVKEPARPARAHSFPEEPATARRNQEIPDEALSSESARAAASPAPPAAAAALAPPVAPPPVPPPPAPAAPPAPPASDPALKVRGARDETTKAPPVRAGGPPPPPPLDRAPLPPPPAPPPPQAPLPPRAPVDPAGAPAAGMLPPTLFGGDEVDSLLDSFGVSNQREDKVVARDLKAIAGLSPTPPPPDAKTLAELTKDVGRAKPAEPDDDGVEALLALADASVPLPTMQRKIEPDEMTPLVRMPMRGLAAAAPESDPKLPAAPPPAAPAPAYAPPLPPEPTPRLDDRPIAAKNLPPSPLFGGGGAASPDARGAPAALRQVSAAEASEPTLPREIGEPPPKRTPPPPATEPAKAKSGSSPRAEAVPQTSLPTKKTRPRKRAPKTGMALLVLALLVVAGGTAAIWKFAPQVFTGRPSPTEAPPPPPPPPPPRCKVALVLSDVAPNAEILLRVGQAPVDVERMPMGTRLEFVATAEGHAPRRAVVQAEATWDKAADGKPRIEVPIQIDASKAKPGQVDPWPAAEPGSQVGGSGAPGTVHVVSNVRGAEVWLLAGLGPEARIDQLRCDGDIDVLIAGSAAAGSSSSGGAAQPLRKRLHVAEKDIAATAADAQGNKVVSLSAATTK